MSCEDMQKKVEAYLDGELTRSDQRDMEAHLTYCARCSAVYQNLRVLSASAKAVGQACAPLALRRKIKSGLREASGELLGTFSWRHLLGVGVSSAALASLCVWLVMSFTVGMALRSQPTDELIAAHVRSMMLSHLTDVDSSDRHTVKPWFNGKLDFSPTVLDLREQGFELVGGRLDYLQKQPVAALVYKRRAHLVNVFIRHGDAVEKSLPISLTHQRGYNLIRWNKDGLGYALVSDLNEKELQTLAGLLQSEAVLKP